MTPSTKPEVHNVSQRRQSHGHGQHAQQIGKVRPCSFRVMRADRQTDRQTDTVIAILQLEAIQRWSAIMSRVTLNFDLPKIPFVHFSPGSRPIFTPKNKHVHLLVLIWERLQTPTTTMTTTTTTPDATVQPLGRHIANKPWQYCAGVRLWVSRHSLVVSAACSLHSRRSWWELFPLFNC